MSGDLSRSIKEGAKLPVPSPEEQRRLREALNQQAERITEQQARRITLAHAICGKYAFVQTNSNEFAASKAEEIEMEDRPR